MGKKRANTAEAPALDVANTDTEALALPEPEVILADGRASAAEAKGKAAQVVALLKEYGRIEDADGAVMIGQVMRAAQASLKELEAIRKKIVTPINAFKDLVQDAFNPPKAEYETAIGLAKGAIVDWTDRQEAERKALEAKAVEAFKAGDKAAVPALVAASAAPVELGKGVSTRKVWVATVDKPEDLVAAWLAGTAPKNLVVIDDSALQAFAKATKGTAALPGVSFEEKTVVTGRA